MKSLTPPISDQDKGCSFERDDGHAVKLVGITESGKCFFNDGINRDHYGFVGGNAQHRMNIVGRVKSEVA